MAGTSRSADSVLAVMPRQACYLHTLKCPRVLPVLSVAPTLSSRTHYSSPAIETLLQLGTTTTRGENSFSIEKHYPDRTSFFPGTIPDCFERGHTTVTHASSVAPPRESPMSAARASPAKLVFFLHCTVRWSRSLFLTLPTTLPSVCCCFPAFASEPFSLSLTLSASP